MKGLTFLAAGPWKLVFLQKRYHRGDFGLGDVAEFSEFLETQSLGPKHRHGTVHSDSSYVLGEADLSTINL